MADLRLADIVRDKLDTGSLPAIEPDKTWAGYGHGDPCSACDQPILAAQIEYELDYRGRPTLRMHAGCHGIWSATRHRRPGPQRR